MLNQTTSRHGRQIDITAMVVEDGRFMRGLLLQGLKAMGVAVVAEADSAETALEKLARIDIDLLITDVEMPGKSGLDLVRLIRIGETPAKPQTRVIVVTGLSDLDILKQAVSLDIQGFLTKPITAKALEDKVHEVLKRSVKLRFREDYLASEGEVASPSSGRPHSTSDVLARPGAVGAAPVARSAAASQRQNMTSHVLPGQPPSPEVAPAGPPGGAAPASGANGSPRQVSKLKEGMVLGVDITVRDAVLVQAGTRLTSAHIKVLTGMLSMLDQKSVPVV